VENKQDEEQQKNTNMMIKMNNMNMSKTLQNEQKQGDTYNIMCKMNKNNECRPCILKLQT
jgi:hypothetical protein